MTAVDLILAALSLAAALLLAFAVLARRLPRRTSADNPEHVAATRAAFMETDAWFAEVEAATGKRLRAVSASERLTAFDVAVVALSSEYGPPKDRTRFPGVGRAAAMWQWDWGGFVLKVNGRLTIHLRTGDVRREIVVDDLGEALGEVRTWHAANAVARAA